MKSRGIVRFFNTVEPVISLYRAVGEGLLSRGYQVEVVVTSGQYRLGGASLASWAVEKGVRLITVPGIRAYPRTGILKLLVAVYYALFATMYGLVGRQSAVNVFLTQPPFFFAMGGLLKALRRQPFMVIAMDVYPDVLVAFGKLKHRGVAHRALHAIAYGSLRKADAVVSIGRCMSDRLAGHGIDAGKIRLIQNWAEPWLVADCDAAIPGRADRNVLTRLGFGFKFVVLYSGNMGAGHTFDELIEAAVSLREHEQIQFVIVGEGVRRQQVESRVVRESLQNVHFLPYQERAVAASLMAEADVHLVIQSPGFEGVLVPSKAYSALAVGRPVLYVGRANGEIARMVLEESVGMVIPPGQPDELASACLALANDDAARRALGARARSLAALAYSRARAQADYMTLIEQVAGDGKRELNSQTDASHGNTAA